ncbi:MAG: EVE domain-containing protein [Bacteriovoracaceae bacterium]
MKYWIMKTEPDVFSIKDLEKKETQCWDGVRNYQARNFMKEMKLSDKIIFYHSSTEFTGAAGLASVCKVAYPDHTQFDVDSDYYDAKATLENPRWFMVDLKFEKCFKRIVSLEMMRGISDLADLIILKRGNRLSITPCEKSEYEIIKKLGL